MNKLSLIALAFVFTSADINNNHAKNQNSVYKGDRLITENPIDSSDIEDEFIYDDDVYDEDTFKYPINIFWPDTYSDQSFEPGELVNDNWFDLYEKDGDYFIDRVSYSFEDGYNECTGDSTVTILSNRNTLLMMDYQELKTGQIKSSKLTKTRIWPGEKMKINVSGANYFFRAEGKNNDDSQKDGSDETWYNVEYYKLYVRSEKSKEELIIAIRSFNDEFVELLFAGDIDGDNKADFIFSTASYYEERKLTLFLSSKAETGKILKRVADRINSFAC